MNKKELESKLELLTASKKDRVGTATTVVQYKLLPELIQFCDPESGISHQACWCLEQVFLLFESACYPFLKEISALFVLPINASGMRSLVKIASIISKKFYASRPSAYQELLTQPMRQKMLEGCFQVLLDDVERTANLAFATRAVYQFGKEFEWVYPELIPVIEQLLSQSPKGYIVVGSKTLKLLKKA